MRLLTKQVEKALSRNPIYSHEGDENPKIIAKFFNPMGRGTWYITEGEKQLNGDWLLFGLCCIHEPELGYVRLSELESVRLPFGMTIKRDRNYHGTLADAREQARRVYC